MKTFWTTLIFIFALGFSTAQISEGDRSMVNGIQNALSIDLPDADDKMVKKVWKIFLKQYDTKPKKVKDGDELICDDVIMYDIGGSNSIDLYSRIDEGKNHTTFITWFDLGGAYLNSSDHRDAYKEAEKILLRFALDVMKTVINEELEDEEDNLKKVETKLSKLKKDNKKYHNEIEKAKEKIARMEKNIIKNEADQEKTVAEIKKQQEIVNKVKKKLDDLN